MSDDRRLNDLKAEIRSLIVSSPIGLTVRRFLREYLERIGRPFPHRDFGFEYPHDFLASLRDVVQFESTERGTVLVPVRSEHVAHINDLVQNQKKQRPVNGFFGRIQKPQMINSLEYCHPMPPPEMMTFPETASSSAVLTAAEQQVVVKEENPFPIVETEAAALTECFPEQDTPNTTDNFPSNVNVKEENAEKKSEQLDVPNVSTSSANCDSGRVVSPIESLYNDQISDRMKENFRLILQENSKGIPASKFCSLYKEKFGCSLNIQDLGYNSLKELIISLPNIFIFEKAKFSADWTVFDARINPKKKSTNDPVNKWIPYNVLDNFVKLTLRYPDGIRASNVLKLYEKEYGVRIDIRRLGYDSIGSFLVHCSGIHIKVDDEECVIYPKFTPTVSKDESDSNNAFPPPEALKNFWKNFFPEEVCDPSCNYKKFVIPEVMEIKANVSDVHSPDALWLQPIEDAGKLMNLMFELNMFYDDIEVKYMMPEEVVIPGLLCCVRFHLDNRWYRSKILESAQDNKIKVCYVDYGTVNFEKPSDLRFLHKKFLEEPVHVVRAKLHNLVPFGGGEEWPNKTNYYLFELLYSNQFYVSIQAVEESLPLLSIVLIDTTHEADIYIHDLLIGKNMATCTAIMEVGTGNEAEVGTGNEAAGASGFSDSFLSVLQALSPAWMFDPASSADLSTKFAEIQEAVDHNVKETSDLQTCCQSHFVRDLFLTDPVSRENICKIWHNTVVKNLKILYQDFFTSLTSIAYLQQKYFTMDPFCEAYSLDVRRRGNLPSEPVEPPPFPMAAAESRKPDREPARIVKTYEVSSEEDSVWEKLMKASRSKDVVQMRVMLPRALGDGSEMSKTARKAQTQYSSTRHLNCDKYRSTRGSVGDMDGIKNNEPDVTTVKLKPKGTGSLSGSQRQISIPEKYHDLRQHELAFEVSVDDNRTLLVVRILNILYVAVDQLLRDFIRGIPTMLLKHKTSRLVENPENILVTSKTHPGIYLILRKLAVLRDGGHEAVLIPLNNTCNFFRTIIPHDKHIATYFEYLAKHWNDGLEPK